ncbi:MAG: putative sulfate exporter family transporter [Pseudomonadota bacterium]
MLKLVTAGVGDIRTDHAMGALRRLLPGLLVVAATAAVAIAAGRLWALPPMLVALLIGLAVAQWRPAIGAEAGVAFSAKTLLRAGIVLLGARISVGDIAAIGVMPFLTVALALPATILFGLALARMLGRDAGFGLLTGSSVAVCGASAALAVSTVLARRGDAEERLCGVVAVVTVLSSLAMLSYPPLLAAMGFGAAETGVVLGATIHDVGQVVAAGYSVSEETGDVATVVKLARVMLLPVVVVVLAAALAGGGGAGQPGTGFPLFILGFLGLVLVNSLGLLPEAVVSAMSALSGAALVAAIAAIGLRTKLAKVLGFGWMLPAVLLGETLFLAALVTLLWL